MPSQKSESTTEPWKGYQPYLIGSGQPPSWLSQGAPTGLTDAMASDMAARAAGSQGSWLQVPPINFGGQGAGIPGEGPFINDGSNYSPISEGVSPTDQIPEGWFYGGIPGLASVYHTDWTKQSPGSIFFGGG